MALLGLVPAVQLFLIREVVDRTVAALGGGIGWSNVAPIALFAALMGATVLLQLGGKSALGWLRVAQAELTRDHLASLVHEKARSVDLAFYELPAYHDLLERVRGDLRERPLALLEGLGGLAQSVITLGAMAAILFTYGFWLPLLLLLSALPILLVVLRYNLRHHELWRSSTTARRWANYYDTILTLDQAAPELRVFGLGPHFQGRYDCLRTVLRGERLELSRREQLANFAAQGLGLLVTAAAMAWMLWQALLGQATLGDVALLYQALSNGQALTGSLMTSAAHIYGSSLFLGDLFEFLHLKPEITDPVSPVAVAGKLKNGIEFKEVTFRYPGSDRYIFQDFDFHIPAGSIVAVVGANGAGKTTLMKLLCRFYDPESGSIELDGTDIRSLSVENLHWMMTGLFQVPVPYAATARENITVGDVTRGYDHEDVVHAARYAGAHELIENLPHGYETLMGKWFPEGTQLSGGEWQRLALSRAFIRRAPIMILDEPTSHLDSWAQADWFDRLRARAAGCTALLITHQFITARHADVIHVMDPGRIVESGRHEELVALGGRYAQSWEGQTKESPIVVP